MKKILFFLSLFSQLAIFLLMVITVLALTYIVARPYLIGSDLWGNDVYSYFAVVKWVNDYFPNVPFWYPVSGGGVSLVSAYPTFSAYLISLISRLSPLDLVQSFRLFGFLTVPFLAIGVFLFVTTRLQSINSGFNRAVLGFVAAIFVVVSPNSWIWLTRWGFYAESSSYIFVPFAILFFDMFLENVLENKKSWGYKVGLLGTIIFTYLAFMSHFLALASLVVFFAFYTLIRILLYKENKISTFKRVFSSVFVLGSFFAGIILYKYFAYKFYMDQVAFGGFTGYGQRAWQELANNTLPIKMMLSLEMPTTIIDTHALIFDTRFHLFVWILFFLGAIISIRKSAQVFAMSLYGILGLILSTILPLKFFISGIPVIGTIANLMEDRGFLIVARVIVPVVAVYGAYMIWEVLIKNKFISLVLSLILISILTYKLYYKPYDFKFMMGTGVENGVLDLRDIWNKKAHTQSFIYSPNYRFLIDNPEYLVIDSYLMSEYCLKTPMELINENDICNEYLNDKGLLFPDKKSIENAQRECLSKSTNDPKYQYCKAFYKPLTDLVFDQLKFSNWPKFEISSSVEKKKSEVEQIFEPLSSEKGFRYDMSGFAGGVIMSTPIFTNNSQLQIYINTASLIYNSWNYLGQVMYSSANVYQKPNVLTELGKWFGLDYVYLTGSDLEPIAYWNESNDWVDINKWRKFNGSTGLATWSDKPKVLIVTDVKRGLFDQFFRFATQGGLSYETADFIIGQKNVDSYSLEELTRYDVIIMRGYDYSNKNSAYSLLDKYIKQGGVLVFDTGWQYEIPDYVIEKAPNFMPFDGLVWKNLSTKSNFSSDKYDVSSFGDMSYGDLSWGVSLPTKLRTGTEVLVSYDDKPLMVESKYGQGKVVWSGFNLVAHSMAKDSVQEAIVFGQILKDNLSGTKQFESNIKFTRNNPDNLEFVLDRDLNYESQIYFRESYFPYWQANLIGVNGKKTKLSIERSGPGFMIIHLPNVSKGEKVVLSIKIGLIQKIVTGISFLSVVLLLIFVFYPKPFEKIKLPKLKIKNPFIKKPYNEDEDY